MHLSKHHGLGNDFLVVLRDDVVPLSDDVAGALAVRLCHRTRGVGADGLIIGGPAVRRIACDLQMWLFNADGSRAEMSGNGIRCLAQAVIEKRGVTEATLMISTDGGLRRVDIKATGAGRSLGECGHGIDRGGRASCWLAPARPRSIAAGRPRVDREPSRRRRWSTMPTRSTSS